MLRLTRALPRVDEAAKEVRDSFVRGRARIRAEVAQVRHQQGLRKDQAHHRRQETEEMTHFIILYQQLRFNLIGPLLTRKIKSQTHPTLLPRDLRKYPAISILVIRIDELRLLGGYAEIEGAVLAADYLGVEDFLVAETAEQALLCFGAHPFGVGQERQVLLGAPRGRLANSPQDIHAAVLV